MAFSTFPNNPFPPSTAQFENGKNDAIQAEIDAIKDGANIDSFADVESALALKANSADMTTALATKTNLSNIAPAFDATSGVYAVGDKVIYEGVLYEFTSAHSTAGEWDESEVQPVKVSELIDSLMSGLTNIGGRFAVVEGTTAAAVDQFSTVSMPSGFGAYNTVIIGFASQFSNDLWYTNNSGLIVDANAETVYVTVKDAGFASKPVKVVLYKFA